MPKQRYEALFLTVLLCLLLPIPSSASPTSSHEITFSTTTYLNPYDIQLDFKVEIDATPLSDMPSGKSKDITVTIHKDWATSTLELDPFLPQEKMFLTPLGDSNRIYVGSLLGDLAYYIELTNASILMEIGIEGNGTVSPSSLLWSSTGSKSFTVSHEGSTSSEETLALWLSFKYMGSLTVLAVAAYGIVADRSVQEMNLEGDYTLSRNIEVAPPEAFSILVPLIVVLFILASGIAIFVYVIHYRPKRMHA